MSGHLLASAAGGGSTASNGLPRGWIEARIDEIVNLNPRLDRDGLADDGAVSFVPMASVEEESGHVDVSRSRPYSEVRKGYTPFLAGDVIMAKITPCMENGKIAVVPELIGGVGFGSTEFHVLRTREGIEARWLFYFLLQPSFRRAARMRMGGSAGQLRVPAEFLAESRIPVAPLAEQRRIVAEIEAQFSRLDAGVAALKRVAANLKRYKAAVLKAACDGSLTPDWRAAHPDVEPAGGLLKRILAERRRRWEQAERARLLARGKPPTDDRWKARYEEPQGPKTADLPPLPKTWTWATVEQVCTDIVDCPHATPKWTSNGKFCVRTTEFRPGKLLLDQARFVSKETFESRVARLRPAAGDVLYSREGGILGIACMVPPDAELCLGQRMMLMRTAIDGSLLMHVLNSPFTLTAVKQLTGGSASPHLNVGDIKQFPVPVPPAEEQYVLSEQIDDCMSIVEAVDAAVGQNTRRATALRQAILRDAFAGKLVPQDPADEPAAALLERIRAREKPAAPPRPSRPRRQPRPRRA